MNKNNTLEDTVSKEPDNHNSESTITEAPVKDIFVNIDDEYVPPPSRRLCTKTAVQDGQKRTGEDEEDDSEKGQRTMSYGGVQWGGALTGN